MYQPKLIKRANGVPIMHHSEIDFHAEEFLRDYSPTVLKNPQPVNIEEFAEFYLDLTMDYTYLSQCGLILGRMIFQKVEKVPFYLPEKKCADYLYAERGTMLIDNTVLNDWNEYRLRSTIGHECGHWLFHSDYYLNADNISYRGNVSESEIKGCRKADIESSTEQAAKRKFKTDFDWLEHHAKYFSAAILMPKTLFINTVLDLRGNSYHDDANLAESLSKIFLVSPSSAKIRLAQLGLHECMSDEEKIQNTL